MKEQDLPECGRYFIFESSNGIIKSGITLNGENIWVPSDGFAFYEMMTTIKGWVYASDALAAWKREQVRREDSPPEDFTTPAIREYRRYEIAKGVLAADVSQRGRRGATDIEGLEIDTKIAISYADALLSELEKP